MRVNIYPYATEWIYTKMVALSFFLKSCDFSADILFSLPPFLIIRLGNASRYKKKAQAANQTF